MLNRAAHAWRAMDSERRLALVAALALFVSMFLPWYQQNAVVNAPKSAPLLSRNLNAFQVFSFVEAAVLLVALALSYMLFARAEGREFQMPGGDGTVVLAAGAWVALLLVVRLFDKPGISTHGVAGNVGVQWGIFFALAAAGMVIYTGSRMRAGRRPGAPLRREPGEEPHTRPRARASEQPYATDARGEEPRGEEPRREEPHRPRAPRPPAEEAPERSPANPDEEATAVIAPSARPAAATPAAQHSRPRYPPGPSDQLSFEDPSE